MVLSKQELWSKSSLWALSSYHGFFFNSKLLWVTKTKYQQITNILTNINNVKQKSDENDKKYKLGNYRLIQCQIL